MFNCWLCKLIGFFPLLCYILLGLAALAGLRRGGDAASGAKLDATALMTDGGEGSICARV